jgi:hypothetical protein
VSRLRPGDERGSPSVELLGMLPLILLFALAAWQLLLFGATYASVENAARTGSRTAALQGVAQAEAAAVASLSSWLQEGASASVAPPTRMTVTVEVPLLFPGLTRRDLVVTRTAEFPPR